MSRLNLAYFLHKSFFDVYIGTHRQTPDFCWSAYLYKTLIFCDCAKDEFFDDDTITPPVAAKIGELVDFFANATHDLWLVSHATILFGLNHLQKFQVCCLFLSVWDFFKLMHL